MITAKPDISSVVQSENIELRQRGRLFWARCPFHQERTPSFSVDPERQRWRCFGACNGGGDVISFIQKLKGLTFPGALSYLGISGVDNRPARPSPEELRRRESVRRFRRWEQLARRALSELVRLANKIDQEITTPEDFELTGVADMYLSKFVCEYYLDVLNGDNDELKFQLYKEVWCGNN